jgi:ADP-ribose pyrophosphatase YjhB (NUDIX family)
VRRFCPACKEIVFREHKIAAGVVVTREGKVLLVRRRLGPRAGSWSIPAGFVDHGEDPLEAAVRECREETGLEVEVTGLLAVIAGREHPRGADVVIVYRARAAEGEPRAGDDADRAAFFAADELPPLAFRATRVALDEWQDTEPGRV